MTGGPRRTRYLPILVGIGLVLVGLLGGILLMLVVDRPATAVLSAHPVERIDLGGPAPRLSVRPADSSGGVVVDPLRMNQLFSEVAGHVTPAVVYIQVEVGSGDGGTWFHQFDNRFFRDRAPRQSVGSGVIISEEGHIVTNHHVVEDAAHILVTLADNRQYEAELVGFDRATDLAVLQVDRGGDDLPVIALGNSDDVKVGEWVLAVGNPFRLKSTVTTGIVSALGRQVNIIGDSFGIEDFIQTDAAINPGNSGGALVSLNGELVGINTAIATESGSYEGYGFAVPVNLMDRVVRDLIAFGEVQRGYLGVEIGPVDARLARQLELSEVAGAYLANVFESGAAYRGGLRNGDVVLSIDGYPIGAPNELQSVIARRRPGDRVAIDVWRSGRLERYQVELFGKQDPDYASWFDALTRDAPPPPTPEPVEPPPNAEIVEVDAWGLGLRPMTDRELDEFATDAGVYVAFVERGSPAAAGGLPRGVALVGIDGLPITDPGDVLRALAAARDATVLVRVLRPGGTTAFFELEGPR